MDNIFLILLFYFVAIPLSVLLHEVGHGLGVVLTSKSTAKVYLGNRDKTNEENFKLGRLHFHIHWSYFGFCSWNIELTKQQKLAAFLGGPLMSLLTVYI